MSENIGLIGIGLVGTALAERFLERGFGVVGFDVDSDSCRRFSQLGGRVVQHPRAVAEHAGRVILALPDSAVVHEVVTGEVGILQASRLPSCIVDTTTGDPDATVNLAELLAERGVAYLDATLSGSSQQIRAGMAICMLGATVLACAACEDLTTVIAAKTFHLGPAGSGSRAKLASNLILGLNRLALAEGLVFAEKMGLELKPFLDMLRVSPAYSVAMDTKGEKMLREDFVPQARLRQHHKDVRLILKHAAQNGLDLPLSTAHMEILQRAIDAGDGDLDNSAVIRELRRGHPGERDDS